jgi:hypothetical protein
MKYIKMFVLSVFVCLITSCHDYTIYNYRYYKAFFLGDDNVTISGTVFNNYENETPAIFDTIYAGTEKVEGWEVIGTKNGSNFELVLKTASNGVVLSSDTIDDGPIFASIFSHGHITRIEFYIDDSYPFAKFAYYKEPNPESKKEYNFWSYYYVYVAEPINLSGTEKYESVDVFGFNNLTTYYYTLNFDKCGWYKICYYTHPINNAPKHFSGNNTNLY